MVPPPKKSGKAGTEDPGPQAPSLPWRIQAPYLGKRSLWRRKWTRLEVLKMHRHQIVGVLIDLINGKNTVVVVDKLSDIPPI